MVGAFLTSSLKRCTNSYNHLNSPPRPTVIKWHRSVEDHRVCTISLLLNWEQRSGRVFHINDAVKVSQKHWPTFALVCFMLERVPAGALFINSQHMWRCFSSPANVSSLLTAPPLASSTHFHNLRRHRDEPCERKHELSKYIWGVMKENGIKSA